MLDERRWTGTDGRERVTLGDPEVGGTIPALLLSRAAAFPDETILREKLFGIWQPVTWAALLERARRVGLALRSIGFGAGDVACVLSDTNPEWVYADLGVLSLGGISAGIYPTDAPAQVEYLLNNSGARVLFVEDEEQLDKALQVRPRCPALERIVVFDMKGLHDLSDPMCESFDAFLNRAAGGDAAAWAAAARAVQPADLAILVYTSGTTGPPKGAMISHANVLCQIVNGTVLLGQKPGDERLAFLPMCHVAERIVGLYQSLYSRTISNYVESPDTLLDNLREVQPTVFGAVPRIWEKFHSATTIGLSEATRLQRAVYRWAIGIGRRRAERQIAGRPRHAGLELAYAVARFVALRNIRRSLGIDRCRWAYVGAAPISPELIRWYLAIGLDMVELYGQTECTGIATATPVGRPQPGSVGLPVPYAEVAISPQGEILLRGDMVFQGYWQDPEKTAETLRDGWLHTGDVGSIDEAGRVHISDRMKDIIITAGGKNITPSAIENELKFSPYIADAVVIGDRRSFLTCLIMIDHENVEKFAQDRDVPFTNFTSLTRAQPVRELVEQEVEKVNARFARVEQIKRFRLIEHKLEAEDPELTPTMKLKRKFVNERYADTIEAMYREG